ncbi:MAG: helix-turn-helix domain-containing protein [Planctomycetota bacterium]
MGLFAFDRSIPWLVLLACQQAQLSIPEDVSLVCGGDDEAVFEALTPSVSGVLYDSFRVGYLAAEAIDRLIAGRPVDPARLVPPLGVIERESSSFLAIDDPEIEAMVRYIWQHVDEQVKVNDLTRRFPIAQRTLTRRFKKLLGHGPAEEIRRSRLETARRLLISSKLSLAQVAVDAGYGTQSRLTHAIRQSIGMTPGQLRRQHRNP